jgi:restriction system protein
MLPLLQFCEDQKIHTLGEAVNYISGIFGLSDDEKNQVLPSGLQTIIVNRVGWAKTYLKKACLIEDPKRATIRITQRGIELLKEKPKEINTKYLERFDEFVIFRKKKGIGESGKDAEASSMVDQIEKTPEESIEYGYSKLKESISEDIIGKIKECSATFFERLVIELLVKMGYGGTLKEAGKVIGKTGDGGIDGIIKEDKLGLDVIYVQAKRWENVVGRPEIQKFAGALLGQKAKKGIFITTSWYTNDALEFVRNLDSKIVLIDGEMLTELMIEYNLGVSPYKSFELKKLDSDYFTEE